MNILKRAKILFDAYNNRKMIEKAHDLTKPYSLAKFTVLFGKQPRQDDFPLHPAYGQISLQKINSITEFKKTKEAKEDDLTVIVGDSLSDFTRNQLSSCYPALNLALAGQGSSYYERILLDTYEALKDLSIKFLVIECWGNEFLGYFDLETVKQHASKNVQLARKLYPNAKIILIGLPPIYDIYANTCKLEFDKHLFDLAIKDGNSCFVALHEKFSGAFGIFPKIDYSSDGVHFTGKGIIEYDEVINRAKNTQLSIVL